MNTGLFNINESTSDVELNIISEEINNSKDSYYNEINLLKRSFNESIEKLNNMDPV